MSQFSEFMSNYRKKYGGKPSIATAFKAGVYFTMKAHVEQLKKIEAQLALAEADRKTAFEDFAIQNKCIADQHDEIAKLKSKLNESWCKVEPCEGTPVVYVGVHVLQWGKASEPTVGFVQYEQEN